MSFIMENAKRLRDARLYYPENKHKASIDSSSVEDVIIVTIPGTTFGKRNLERMGYMPAIASLSSERFITGIQVYMSLSGVKLIQQVKKVKQTKVDLSQLHRIFDKDPLLISHHIFIEYQTTNDRVSGRYFEIARSGTEGPGEKSFFDAQTLDLKTALMKALYMRDSQRYNEFIDRTFKGGGWLEQKLQTALKAGSSQMADLMGILGEGVEGLGEFVYDLKLPGELWDPKHRPRDFDEWLGRISSEIESTARRALTFVENIPQIRVDRKSSLATLLPDLILDFLDRIADLMNSLSDFISDAAKFLKKNIPNIKDTIDTLIGYLSGLWDGLIDLVGGIIDMVALLLLGVQKYFEARSDFRTFQQMIRESSDEIIQALNKVNWPNVLYHIQNDTYPKMVKLFEDKLHEFMTEGDNAGVIAYHFGYLVFSIIENFFPPLKLGRAASLAGKLPKSILKFMPKLE